MEEQLKVELERIKMTNYVLQKENEILLESVSKLSAEKEELLNQVKNSKKSFIRRAVGKIKNHIKKN